jgi:hypothetical protein
MLKPPAHLRKQSQRHKKHLESSRDVLTAEKKGFGFAESRYSQKAQSAMEYLMTYGWSILVIAVVIGALFELGVFNSGGNALPNACIPQSGYICSNPQLSSTGNLLITFGQAYGSVITVTGTGCSGSTAQPSTFSSTDLSFASGAENSLVFSCPTTSNAMGTEFHGTLWIEYTRNNVLGIISQVAEITAKATTTNSFAGSGSGSPQTSHYVSITLSNQQSSGTAANFQQMVFFNPSLSQYTQYEASNLSNIEFTSGAPAGQAGSTPMYAWLESGASTSATNTVAWVNLGSSTLGAAGSGSNTLTIYMNFMPNNAPVTSGYTGYAPQLWCASGCFQTSYAQYDDGASVFTNYWNFAGTNLPSGWINNPSGITVNNGITITGQTYALTTSNYGLSNYYLEGFVDFTNIDLGISQPEFGYSNSKTSGTYWQVVGFDANQAGGAFTATSSGSYTFSGPLLSTNVYKVYSIYLPSSSDAYFYVNYSNFVTITSYIPTSQLPIGFSNMQASSSDVYKAYWLRTRSYPPNGVMPSVSFGSVS